MDRYERINALHRLLKASRYPVTVARLQDELGCSRATVYRDLAFLRDALMAPVEGDGEAGFCYRKDESERFRIPSELRNPPSQEAAAQSWANRAETMMEVNRVGLPDSCSPVGTGGQTGCNQQLLRQWYQQRKAQQQAEQFPRSGD